LGRLVEGHADAVAILAEAGRMPACEAAYGVWAAKSPDTRLKAEDRGNGWLLHGAKPFCSGAGTCDRALVTAESNVGELLFDVDLDQPGVQPIAETWPAVGMAGSDSRAVRFDQAQAGEGAQVGRPGFYTGRPGFWHGGVGVAACWYGGARALVDHSVLAGASGEAELAQLGTALATVDALWALLARAAAGIDEDPADWLGQGRRRALTARHAVYTGSLTILANINGAGGARPWCLHAGQSQRAADLYSYLAQHHPGRDGAALGRLSVESRLDGGR
jgi:alkylation response protein AidB-like acyl-CoA dehydrogenase